MIFRLSLKYILWVLPCLCVVFYASRFFPDSKQSWKIALEDECLNEKPITVVSGYFQIGKFEKGTSSGYFYTKKNYILWLSAYSLIKNPLIFFVEEGDEFGKLVKNARKRLPQDKTIVVEMKTSEMRSFKLLPNISNIFSKPNYPKHSPNTMVPMYAAAVNSKYELTHKAILENPFKSCYFIWTDVGIFRDLAENTNLLGLNETEWKKNAFDLVLPEHFNNASHIAYNLLYDIQNNLSASSIIKNNQVWIGGGYFVGRKELMLVWTEEYLKAVDEMIRMGWISTDQQVIYWLFSNANKTKVTTKIQGYRGGGRGNEWFHLAYLSLKLGF